MQLEDVTWTAATYQAFLTTLATMGQAKSQARTAKIVPTDYPILGVGMRDLRLLATQISHGQPRGFLAVAGAENYEVILERAYVLGQLKLSLADFKTNIAAYLQTADNWVICDMVIHFKQVKQFLPEFLPTIKAYLADQNVWLQRSGFIFLLKFYLTPAYFDTAVSLTVDLVSSDYYVQLGQAWLLATAFTKQPATITTLLAACDQVDLVKLAVRKITQLSKTTPAQKATLRELVQAKRG